MPLAAVPKAAVYEDRQSDTGKDDVGTYPTTRAEVKAEILTKAKTAAVQCGAQRELRSGIASAVCPHRRRGVSTSRGRRAHEQRRSCHHIRSLRVVSPTLCGQFGVGHCRPLRQIKRCGDLLSKALSDERWDGVSDLARHRSHRLIFEQHKIVRKAHQARRLSDSDRTVLSWMEIAALLRLVKLGANRRCRFVSPEPSEHVVRARSMAAPTRRDEVTATPGVEFSLHVEAISAGRHGSVTLNTLGLRVSVAVPIPTTRLSTHPFDCFVEGRPSLVASVPELGVGVGLFWPWDGREAASNYEGTRATLRNAIVGDIQYAGVDLVVPRPLDRLFEFGILRALKHLRHVLHDEEGGTTR